MDTCKDYKKECAIYLSIIRNPKTNTECFSQSKLNTSMNSTPIVYHSSNKQLKRNLFFCLLVRASFLHSLLDEMTHSRHFFGLSQRMYERFRFIDFVFCFRIKFIPQNVYSFQFRGIPRIFLYIRMNLSWAKICYGLTDNIVQRVRNSYHKLLIAPKINKKYFDM